MSIFTSVMLFFSVCLLIAGTVLSVISHDKFKPLIWRGGIHDLGLACLGLACPSPMGPAGFVLYLGFQLVVRALALSTLDSVARIGRMSFQELFSVDDMEHAEGWRRVLCNKYFSTLITLVFGYILTQVGYSNIWPLFGSANQLLSALVLITLCVFLKVTGRELRTLVPPFVIMLVVTFSALVQRFISLVRAFMGGTGVFMVEGLQLIVAVLLMILGVTIVFTSGKELIRKKAEK